MFMIFIIYYKNLKSSFTIKINIFIFYFQVQFFNLLGQIYIHTYLYIYIIEENLQYDLEKLSI